MLGKNAWQNYAICTSGIYVLGTEEYVMSVLGFSSEI